MKLYVIGISALVAVALSACGSRCQTVSQEVAYLDENGQVAVRTIEREICPTATKMTASNNPVHSGSGSMTAGTVWGTSD